MSSSFDRCVRPPSLMSDNSRHRHGGCTALRTNRGHDTLQSLPKNEESLDLVVSPSLLLQFQCTMLIFLPQIHPLAPLDETLPQGQGWRSNKVRPLITIVVVQVCAVDKLLATNLAHRRREEEREETVCACGQATQSGTIDTAHTGLHCVDRRPVENICACPSVIAVDGGPLENDRFHFCGESTVRSRSREDLHVELVSITTPDLLQQRS